MTRGDADRNVKSATLDRNSTRQPLLRERRGARRACVRPRRGNQTQQTRKKSLSLEPARGKDHLSSRALPLAGSWLKELLRGKPFGARRPASARLPRQSASSLSVRENARPAASVHDSPSSTLNALTSDSPPSL